MIEIRKSPTADTRTCDWSKVTKEQLLRASQMHIDDVDQGLCLLANMLHDRRKLSEFGMCTNSNRFHDHDKVSPDGLAAFHDDFIHGFAAGHTSWWDNHRKVNRHHIDKPDGVPEDVNLCDVLEHIVDCVMAGMARSGSVYDLKLTDELLQRAFQNTVKLLKQNVEVI